MECSSRQTAGKLEPCHRAYVCRRGWWWVVGRWLVGDWLLMGVPAGTTCQQEGFAGELIHLNLW